MYLVGDSCWPLTLLYSTGNLGKNKDVDAKCDFNQWHSATLIVGLVVKRISLWSQKPQMASLDMICSDDPGRMLHLWTTLFLAFVMISFYSIKSASCLDTISTTSSSGEFSVCLFICSSWRAKLVYGNHLGSVEFICLSMIQASPANDQGKSINWLQWFKLQFTIGNNCSCMQWANISSFRITFITFRVESLPNDTVTVGSLILRWILAGIFVNGQWTHSIRPFIACQ